jgi:hypothetical protein
MVIKFSIKKKKRILCCITDLTETYKSGWAKEISVNLTDNLIYRFDLHKYDIYIGTSEQDLLRTAAKDGFYTHAVIIAAGTSLGLSDRLFPAIEEMCSKEFFIAGHILDRNVRGWELNHQFYIVNLAEYIELGYPPISEGNYFDADPNIVVAPLRSAESLYNDPEVPVWIKPGNSLITYTHKLHGWDILDTALTNNKILLDLGEDIRLNKKYFYYEFDHVFVREISRVYYNHFFSNNFYASWNSDEIQNQISIDKPVEQYISVGIGLNWIKNLIKLNYTSNTRVVFTDINYNCLRFMKALVTSWSGEDYGDFYRQQLEFEINDSYIRDIDGLVDWTNDQWNSFRASFDDWPAVWASIRQLKFEFMPIDYTSTYDLSFIEQNKTTFINLSDLFNHAPPMHVLSLKYRVSAENRLLNKLEEHDPNMWLLLTSRAATGFHPTLNRSEFNRVSKFIRTDMNDLNAPPWHRDDWKVYCLFTGKRKLLT